jgi:hypothetical protein
MKIRRSKLLAWGYLIAAGWFLAVAHAHGETFNYKAGAASQQTSYKTPEDMIDMVPVLNQLPRAMTLGQGYLINLTSEQVRINHRSRETRKTKADPCMIGLSYSTPVAGSLSSQIDLPLFHATELVASDWSRNSLGDYQVTMSRMAVDHAILKLAFSARF